MIGPAYRRELLGWSASLVPQQVRPLATAAKPLVGPLHPVLARFERRLLTGGSPGVAAVTTLALRVLARLVRHTPLRFKPSGKYAAIPRELGLGPVLDIGPGDTLFSAGLGWSGGRPSCIGMARIRGARTAALCYDLIPVTHPALYPAAISTEFHSYWRRTLPLLDSVVVTARCIADDVRRFCDAERLPIPELVQRTLGFNPRRATPTGESLPGGLLHGNYALLVSTIEPRKGHAMLLRAWVRLLEQQIPQRTGFRLVFAGRWGWLVDPVKRALSNPALGTSVLHFSHADDALLERLYDGAALCLYPSVYEGFGLPVLEAFARGKPVLASSCGAVAEVAGQLAPTIDPIDDVAWSNAMAEWITDPARRDDYADRIRTTFQHPAWPEAAAAILDAVANPVAPPVLKAAR